MSDTTNNAAKTGTGQANMGQTPSQEGDNVVPLTTQQAGGKDLYEIGEIPPLGHVPKQMYAWAIRAERHGPPEEAMQLEVLDTPAIDSNEVLVLVMAAGVNYNGVWAGLGQPISVFKVHGADYHIAGSDASGVVWRSAARSSAGRSATRW